MSLAEDIMVSFVTTQMEGNQMFHTLANDGRETNTKVSDHICPQANLEELDNDGCFQSLGIIPPERGTLQSVARSGARTSASTFTISWRTQAGSGD